MKKIIAIILVLVMISSSAAFAEMALDLSGIKNEDLLLLYDAVKKELTARGLSTKVSKELVAGKYIIGNDLQPGRYVITCTFTDSETLGNMYSSLGSIYNDELGSLMNSLGGMMTDISGMQARILGDYGSVIKSYELKKGESVTVTLESNTALEISDGKCTITEE